MTRPRVVVAGLGDTGVLTAVRLAPHADVVGISAKPELVSGQELGLRLTRPREWEREYRVAFHRFRRLRGVRVVHGAVAGLDAASRTVTVGRPDGSTLLEPYDVLVIATGVSNGFWRDPEVQSVEQVDVALESAHGRLAASGSVVVVGGGAAAVSTAANVAATWPDKTVDLYFPGERALVRHHPRVWRRVRARLELLGVTLHPGHRALLPEGFHGDRMTDEPVVWSTGQPSVNADTVVWALGRVRPNTGWLPPALLDENGFVRVTPELQVPGAPGVFAVGDVAATDPLRTSARNRADRLVAANIRAGLAGRPLRPYRPPGRRWGSVLGPQHDGLQIFAPGGQAFRLPRWIVDTVLYPVVVRWGIYLGIRNAGGVAPRWLRWRSTHDLQRAGTHDGR